MITGKDGQVNYKDPSEENKFSITGEDYTLIISNVQIEDAGNFTCRKHAKKFENGGVSLFEESNSTELIVQGRFNIDCKGDLFTKSGSYIVVSNELVLIAVCFSVLCFLSLMFLIMILYVIFDN